MKKDSARLIVGFFPAKIARGVRDRVRDASGDVAFPPAEQDRYASLCLEGEIAVVARARSRDVPRILEKMRGYAGPGAIFAVRACIAPPPTAPGSGDPRVRLRASEQKFTAARGDLEDALRLDHALTAAGEWLQENAYLVRTNAAEARRSLPRERPRPDFTRISGIGKTLVDSTDCALTEAAIESCLRAWPALAMREIWAFPVMLRIALIAALAEVAWRVNRSQGLREEAYLWANRLASAARGGSGDFERILARLEAEPCALEPHFAVCLAEQLQEEESALAPAERWIESKLGVALPVLVKAEHAREAGERLSTANAFGSLRLLAHLEFAKIFESVSVVEAELRNDPARIYPASDFETRDECRRVVAQIARYSGAAEIDVARRAVTLAQSGARHVPFFLLSSGVEELERELHTRVPWSARLVRMVRRYSTPVYLSATVALSSFLVALVLLLAREQGVRSYAALAIFGALALFPLSELAIQFVNALVITLLSPRTLPKLDLRDGIAPENATLVVVPMLLIDPPSVRRELEKLEIRYLANRDANLFYALFSDFTDCPQPDHPADGALFDAARDGILTLNRRYGERFLLFHRPRAWSPSEECWIGRERKRGKLNELNAYLCGEGDARILRAGRLPLPVRYVITLDADTQLPPGTARRMIETIAHPLNRIELDPETRVRRAGYSIIQPRVSIALPNATATRFARIFATAAGTDPYCKAVSDAQQDLFSEAIFHGKAIYDVRAMRTALADRFPTETLLSHDLIEGAHAGVGLASDIELFENLPHAYSGYSRREHRWIRGDWQIAPWILPCVPDANGRRVRNPLSVMNRWRIAENLRRSLAPVASMLLLLGAWLFSSTPGLWTLVVALAAAIPALAPLFDRWAGRVSGTASGWDGAAGELGRATVNLAFLPHQAWLAVDAIARAIYRSGVSRRKMLEWETAEAAMTRAHRHRNATLRQMIVIAAGALALAPISNFRGSFEAAFLFLFLWAASPGLLEWLNQSGIVGRRLRPADSHYLRRQARRTWRYFDDLVNEENHWLPPDNSQLALNVEVAHRTSPTNIGLWLAAALAARDLGYITADDLLARVSKTLDTLERLERYEGHPLNWYDTRTLAPLAPRYVSTVDSGNLLASLWVLEQGFHDAIEAPMIGSAAMHGLRDTLAAAGDVANQPAFAAPVHQLRHLFRGPAEGHQAIARLRLAAAAAGFLNPPARDGEACYWLERLAGQIDAWSAFADRYLAWMNTLAHAPDSIAEELGEDWVRLRNRTLASAPSLAALANGAAPFEKWLDSRAGSLSAPVCAWLDRISREYNEAKANAARTVAGFAAAARRARDFAEAINMRFLYDPARKLFGVGYAVGAPLEFKSHYDLLASECRLASLVAIAKGDVPVAHWAALGRTRSPARGGALLLSWSGTMFEFLMPVVFVPEFADSLLASASRQAVEKQIRYGRQQAIPWGFSESAYSAIDIHRTYQYRAFGVPDLALKRDFEPDLVVAPYATMLALMIDPAGAIANLKRLEALGAAGPMGFYESIDFSRARDPAGDRGIVIYAYMAHHQGMSLAALDNVLQSNALERRFARVLRVRAFESLLYERRPVTREPHAQTERAAVIRRARVTASEHTSGLELAPHPQYPCVHLNGNGRYTLLVTRSGAGFSRWNGFDVTRWRSDVSLDSSGAFLYIRDRDDGSAWIANRAPARSHFSADRAELVTDVSEIETVTEATVAPEDDVELRRVAVSNHSSRARELEFTTYLELALAPHRADTAHPAFSKLFIETESLGNGVLIAHRRPRSPDEAPIWAAHMLTGATGEVEFETDRARFLGRGNTPENPEALGRALGGSAGAVLDPVFSLRFRARVAPRGRIDFVLLTMAAASREALLAMIETYRSRESAGRVFEMAWIRAQLEMRYLRIRPGAARSFEELAGRLLYPVAALRASPQRLARNRLGQTSLWAYGISGDLPILAVTVAESRDLALVREVLLAHAWWRAAGLRADVVILNQEAPGYDRPLRQRIEQHIEAHSAGLLDGPGGVSLRDWEAIPAEHSDLILSAASVVLSASRGSLEQQLIAPPEPAFAPAMIAPRAASSNANGAFSQDGREYTIELDAGAATPAPWVNVIANANFGAMVSESGLGCTWSINSQSNRLTPWHNDPVSDPQSEAIYLRDDGSGDIWTPTVLPIREAGAYCARHGRGYTIFEHASRGISQQLTVFVPPDRPVKVHLLRLQNDSKDRRSIGVYYFAEWMLGSVREDQQLHIRTAFDESSGALIAMQSWNSATAGRVAFAWMNPRAKSWSGDRAAFFGDGSRANPAAVARGALDKRTGAGLDPAAAFETSVVLEPGGRAEIEILIGETDSIDAVRALIHDLDPQRALTETQNFWNALLGAIQVRTPSPSADVMLNGWLLYQALSCRFWGRTAMYQSGGAFGFRDQLQDAMALVYASPEMVREHILRAASRQFVEGDVQHWWHPDTGLGVRTRCSDDLVWLAWAAAQYIKVTGDRAILDEPVAFLEGPALAANEQERMFVPSIADRTAPLVEHCRLALEHAWKLGSHGLPLIGSGDWNDGMNRVGIEGRGESVWLAWFLCATLREFAKIVDEPLYLQRAADLEAATEKTAWDGEWYVRAFFDDGSPLGSHVNREARIDSIAQSWAVISGAADPERARIAMESATRILVDDYERLIELFAPPFDHSRPHPGYIMGYPPGVRENGGQYTHAALWLAMARARMGDGEEAVRLLTMLNPVEHTSDPESVACYAGEPYAIAADVSSTPGRLGRAGWTWYTGSAAWMYRVWLEEVLGFKLRGDTLRIQPSIPDAWPGFTIAYRYRSTTYEIEVKRGGEGRDAFRLVDDGGTHRIVMGIEARARMAPAEEPAPIAANVNGDAHRLSAAEKRA